MAFQHTGEAVTHFRCRLANRHGARNVGGSVLVLRAGIDQEQFAEADRSIGLLRHAIMHDRAMGAGAGNGIEADIARAGAAAEGFQLFNRINFGERFLRPFARQPGKKSRQRLTVAMMRAAVPPDAPAL